MKTRFLKISLAAFIIFSFISAGLQAQGNKSSTGYEPHIGQQGKDVVWVPTPQELVDKMLEIAKVTPDDYVIDLGSGDGRTVITAAKLGATALGVEYNPDMVTLSRENAAREGVSEKAQFIKADLYETDLSKATVITMFLLPEINLKLRPRLLDLKPGTRIVSNTFTMGEWKADLEVTTEENWNSWNTAFLWIIPAKVAGNWKMDNGDLVLNQEFQYFTGTYKSGNRISDVSEGKIKGDSISFIINGNLYEGQVFDNAMSGTYVNNSKGTKTGWSAKR
ncbi:MAG: methyltransferase domain-containing protein [Bacteroidales bacterium]|nr:methyltransferase domain-containing protein [Bacteroidales bacterium]